MATRHETDSRTIWMGVSKLESRGAGGAYVTYDPGEERPQHIIVDRGIGRGTGELRWTYGMWQRLNLDRLPALGRVRLGSPLGHRQDAFDAEFTAIPKGLQSLVERTERGVDYTVFTDSQAAMTCVGDDTPGPGQHLATQVIHTANHLNAARQTKRGIIDFAPHQAWRWAKVHGIPITRYMGRETRCLKGLREEFEAENARIAHERRSK